MEYIAALLPSVCLGLVFWLILRGILHGDRTERSVQARSQEDAERWYEQLRQRDARDLPPGGPAPGARRDD